MRPESRNRLEKQRQLTDRRRQQRRAALRAGLSPKTFQGYNADTGALSLGHAGGTAPLNTQGSLSNAAIPVGTEVSSYNWDAADWKPTLAVEGGDPAGQPDDDNVANFDDEQGEGEGEPADDLPEGTPPLEFPEKPYCSCQNLWARGTPNRDPSDPPTDEECPFLGGQDPGVEYRVFIDISRRNTITQEEDIQQASQLANGEIVRVYLDAADNVRLVSENGAVDEIVTSEPAFIAFLDVQITSTVREDGLPDTGGNLPGCAEPQPETGPPGETDPGAWTKVPSCNPPITYEVVQLATKQQVVVSDATGQIAALGYNKDDDLDVTIRCSEEGPPP
ncbi:MAG: hypothetical protein AAFN18_21140 [Cyanobacteria bacterium J06554_6]